MKNFLLMAGVTLALAACSGQKGQDAAGENPFLSEYNTPFGVPPFDQIKPEHYKPALLQGMEEQKKEIEAIVNQRSMPDFENTIVALDRSGALLNKVAYVFYAQSAACADDEIQALSTEIAPLMAQHSDDINLNPRLFERVKQVYERKADFNLNHEQERLLEKTYRDFVRGGANLDSTKQARLRQLNGEISVLEQTFSQNMLKETNDFKLVIDKKEDLAGLPQALVDNAAATAKAQGMEGKWVFTLHNPSVMPFLQYADNRDLREKIFKGYTNRGNNNNDADNKQVVRSLMQKRLEKAQLMGYKDYAAYVLEDRMAKNSENVYGLLDAVWTPALDKAKEELNDIRAEIKKEGKDFEPEAWDWSYYFEKAKKADKKDPRISLLEGDIALAKKDVGTACQLYEQAIYFDPNCYEAYLKYARAYKSASPTMAIDKLNQLKQVAGVPQDVLLLKAGTGKGALDALVKLGLVIREDVVDERDPFKGSTVIPTTPLPPTPEQAEALRVIFETMDGKNDGRHVVLLHGVTCSGKTEVYLQAIARALEQGGEAIVLVPEISLTPQTVERFRARFGDRVSVLHSGLSDGERHDEWMKVHSGRVRIAVGARSALFAPFTHLKLIVVDEEHEQ